MIKKCFAFLCAITLLFTATTNIFAAENGIKLHLNGKAVELSSSETPINIGGRIMFEVETLVKLLNDGGSAYTCAVDSGSIIIKNAETTVKMTIGSNEAKINEKTVTINGACPQAIGAKSYVPFRFLADAFGMTVIWDAKGNTIGAMDKATMDKVASMMTEYSKKLNADSKLYMEFSADVSAKSILMDQSMTMTMALAGILKQDLANKFIYEKVDTVVDMDQYGAQAQSIELYDDSKNMYYGVDGGFIKSKSLIGEGGFLENLQSQFDLNAQLQLEKESYASILTSTDANGNYVFEGSIVIPEEMMDTVINSALNMLGGDPSTIGDIKISFPKPIIFKYVFDKTTSLPISMEMNFKMHLTGSAIGETTSDYKINIHKIVLGADFESVVPESVTENAIDMAQMYQGK